MSIDYSTILNLFTILASILAGFYLFLKYKQNYWRRRGIYSPPCHWLFGHFEEFFHLRKSPPEILEDLYNSVGPEVPIIGFYIVYKPFLLVRDRECIKNVMIKDFDVFPNRYFSYKQHTDVITLKNLFTIQQPEWKYVRTKVSPMFTSGKQKKLFLIIKENAENLKNYLAAKVGNGKVNLETKSVATRFIVDAISSLTFGVRTNSFVEPKGEFFNRVEKMLAPTMINGLRIFASFFFPEFGFLLRGRLLSEHTDFFRQVFHESMAAREKSSERRGDAIDLLIDLKNSSANSSDLFKFEGDYLLAQSAILLVAGNATSSNTVIFTLLELARNPEIQEKVHAELRDNLPKDGLDYELVSKLTYLNQVVSETLRLYPPAPVLDRITMADYKFPGSDVVIEKGTPVYVILNGLHKDPAYFSDPSKYDPDRFSEENKPNIPSMAYMPFGDGPRICIGMRTGLLQTTVCLITILSKYRVLLNPELQTQHSKTAIFLSPDQMGINLFLEKLPGT